MPLGFVTPRTWVTAELETSSIFNTHIRDQLIALSNAVVLYARDVTVQEVANTLTETTVFSTTVTGGDLSTNRQLRLTLVGDYLNNTGGQENFSVKVKYGGTTFFHGSHLLSNNANRRGMRLDFLLTAGNASTVQYATGSLDVGQPDTVGGVSSTAPEAVRVFANHVSGAVDSSVNQTLEVTYQHVGGFASANRSAKCWMVLVELIAIG